MCTPVDSFGAIVRERQLNITSPRCLIRFNPEPTQQDRLRPMDCCHQRMATRLPNNYIQVVVIKSWDSSHKVESNPQKAFRNPMAGNFRRRNLSVSNHFSQSVLTH